MTSTRLPGKILLPAGPNQTMFDHHIERLRQSNLPIYVATTDNDTDLPLVAFCHRQQLPYTCGSEHNVLSRYYACAKQYDLQLIVRVTSDCPLIDGKLIAQGVDIFLQNHNPYLYISNGVVRTYPRGFDFEIFSFKYLEEAYLNAVLPMDLEHVTPYIHQNRSLKTIFYHFTQSDNKSSYRITLDTPDDYTLLKTLIEQYQAHLLDHSQITQILDENPRLVAINAHIEQKKLA